MSDALRNALAELDEACALAGSTHPMAKDAATRVYKGALQTVRATLAAAAQPYCPTCGYIPETECTACGLSAPARAALAALPEQQPQAPTLALRIEPCSACRETGRIGIPGAICQLCKGTGKWMWAGAVKQGAPAAPADLTDAHIDAIYSELDAWATRQDSYEYGLPMLGEESRFEYRAVVRAALASPAAPRNDLSDPAQATNEGNESGRWISFDERMPAEWESVWMFRAGKQAAGEWYPRIDGERGWTFGGTSYVPNGTNTPAPTHWMPLPAPPASIPSKPARQDGTDGQADDEGKAP